MYPGAHIETHSDQPAFIMGTSGITVTYRELEARSNRLAHFLRARGLGRLDHYSIFMENNDRYLETCAAGERTGSQYTCVNSYLTAAELAYLVQNSESKVLITSVARRAVALEALADCPDVNLVLVADDPAYLLPERRAHRRLIVAAQHDRLGMRHACSGFAGCFAGSVTRKHVRPGSLSTSLEPSWSSTMSRQIESPRPVPSP